MISNSRRGCAICLRDNILARSFLGWYKTCLFSVSKSFVHLNSNKEELNKKWLSLEFLKSAPQVRKIVEINQRDLALRILLVSDSFILSKDTQGPVFIKTGLGFWDWKKGLIANFVVFSLFDVPPIKYSCFVSCFISMFT